MNFSSIFQPNVFVIGVTMCGYGAISFLVKDAAISQAITIPYRGFVLVTSLILLLSNLGIIYPDKKNIAQESKPAKKSRLIYILIFLFLFCYSCRVIYDVFIRKDAVLFMEDRNQYIFLWFFIVLIPGMNFFFLKNTKSENYLLITWIFYLATGFLGVFLAPGDTNQAFVAQGRVGGVALNPIALGGYGVSLATLSLYIWLRNKDLLKILSKNKSWSFVYLIGLSIGIIVVILAASRGPMIRLLPLLLIIILSGKINGKIIVTVLFLSVTIGIVTMYQLSEGNVFLDRLLTSVDEYDSTGKGRGQVINVAINDISENLLTGVGIELKQGGYPHNIIVDSFLPFGLLGGTIFVFILCYTLVKSFKLLLKRDCSWGWLGLLFIQQALAAMSSGSLYGSSEFWYLLFAVVGINDDVCISLPSKN